MYFKTELYRTNKIHQQERKQARSVNFRLVNPSYAVGWAKQETRNVALAPREKIRNKSASPKNEKLVD